MQIFRVIIILANEIAPHQYFLGALSTSLWLDEKKVGCCVRVAFTLTMRSILILVSVVLFEFAFSADNRKGEVDGEDEAPNGIRDPSLCEGDYKEKMMHMKCNSVSLEQRQGKP
jgi:hypothetical protein